MSQQKVIFPLLTKLTFRSYWDLLTEEEKDRLCFGLRIRDKDLLSDGDVTSPSLSERPRCKCRQADLIGYPWMKLGDPSVLQVALRRKKIIEELRGKCGHYIADRTLLQWWVETPRNLAIDCLNIYLNEIIAKDSNKEIAPKKPAKKNTHLHELSLHGCMVG